MPTGNDKVIETLQASLRLHWSAIEAYSAQAAHYEAWGYPKLAAKYKEDAEEERGHAEALLKRLEFFDVQPDLAHEPFEWPRHDFMGALDVDYQLELQSSEVERGGHALSLASEDPVTADIFRSLLESSENSLIEIEAIKDVIEQIGLDNYLANQT